jgi:hypothetical protein
MDFSSFFLSLSFSLRHAEPDCTLPEWRHKKRAGPASPAALMRASKWRIKDHHHPITSSRLRSSQWICQDENFFYFSRRARERERERATRNFNKLHSRTHMYVICDRTQEMEPLHTSCVCSARPKQSVPVRKWDNAPFFVDNSPRNFSHN